MPHYRLHMNRLKYTGITYRNTSSEPTPHATQNMSDSYHTVTLETVV